jgi:hypothetical protein
MSTRTVITTAAAEEGHRAFDVQFKDELGTTVTPTQIDWYLTDVNRRLIDSATSVSPATTITIVLQGSQLELPDTRLKKRFLLVYWEFTSNLGAGIPEYHQIEFDIQDHVHTTS